MLPQHVQCESARRATATGAPYPQVRPIPRTLSACSAQSPLLFGVMTIVMKMVTSWRQASRAFLYPLFIFASSEGLLPRPRGLCHQNIGRGSAETVKLIMAYTPDLPVEFPTPQ